MNQHRLPSDVVGLSKVMPPLSRRGFMSSSGAVAAGYTLATGPVRADAIQTDTNGLDAGDAKISGGDMPVYYARPIGVQHPKVNSKTDTELFADLDATVAWAESQGGDGKPARHYGLLPRRPKRLALLGANPDLKASVAFYGPLVDKSDAAPPSNSQPK